MSVNSVGPWSDRASVSTWCKLPVSWYGKRDGYRTPPRLHEGDARKILRAARLDNDEVLADLADQLDEAIETVANGRDDPRNDREEYRLNRDDYFDSFYEELRKALHPEQVALEEAAFAAKVEAYGNLS